MVGKSLIFVVNPGSASRKYALFENDRLISNIHFELVDNKVAGTIEFDGKKHTATYDDSNLSNAPHRTLPLLRECGVINKDRAISAIGIRIVAPSRKFICDQLVTDAIIRELEELREETPLHIQTALQEIKQLRTRYKGVPIIAISDSAFHVTKPAYAWHYGIDTELAEKYGIERYGYHGISVGSVIRKLKKLDILMPKTIVCHLGSGSSVTAVHNGKSVDNTMGYSPLEGLMMSTRSGSIDVSAAVVIKEKLKLSENELELYLDKKAGLLGVSGSSDDIRQLLTSEAKGDKRAKLALDMFVYRIQQAIGQMAAALDGVNCVVITGTVGVRSAIIRERVLKKLDYLGFSINSKVNKQTYEPIDVTDISSESSKPILIVLTDENVEIARRTHLFINN